MWRIIWKRVETGNSQHKPSCASGPRDKINKIKRCNAVEISHQGAKMFNSQGTLYDCPAMSPQYLFSSSATVHSLIPISSFSKCASITCWTKQTSGVLMNTAVVDSGRQPTQIHWCCTGYSASSWDIKNEHKSKYLHSPETALHSHTTQEKLLFIYLRSNFYFAASKKATVAESSKVKVNIFPSTHVTVIYDRINSNPLHLR